MKWNYLSDLKRKLVSTRSCKSRYLSICKSRSSSGDPGANNEICRSRVYRTMSIVQAEPFQIQVLHCLIMNGITSQLYTSNHLQHNVSTRGKLFNLIKLVEVIVFVSMDKVRWYNTNRCYATKQLFYIILTWFLLLSVLIFILYLMWWDLRVCYCESVEFVKGSLTSI